MWVTPAATFRQLDATRRVRAAGNRMLPSTAAATELLLDGSLGFDPKKVIDELMTVISAQSGLQLVDASFSDSASPGSWRWVAAQDPSAPHGRVRLFLADVEEARRVADAVHGRAIQIGSDIVSISVNNDLIDSCCGTQGNGGRGQASRGPAPASATPGHGRGRRDAPHMGPA